MHTTVANILPSKDSVSLAAEKRILFALSVGERRDFFPRWQEHPQYSINWTCDEDMKPDRWLSKLDSFRPHVMVTGWRTPMLPLEHIQNPQSELSYVCHIVGSVKEKVPKEAFAAGLQVSNWGTTISHTVAEHGLLMVLASLRATSKWQGVLDAESANAGQLKRMLKTGSLRGRRVGLHGFGSVARELILYLQPFHARMSAYSPGVPRDYISSFDIKPAKDLEELFSNNDIIIECEALTPQTRQSVTKKVLECLPDDAVFVNVGRGAVVDEDALVDVAMAKNLRVALDVFASEPVPLDSPLRQIPGVLLSPHIAGPTRDWYPRCGQFAWENVERFFNGQTPLSLVDIAGYERST